MMFDRYKPFLMPEFRRLRQLLLISLMAFTLAGVQLVQVSPLHQHTQESVDCALCHLQFSDDALVLHQVNIAYIAHAISYSLHVSEFYSSSNPSPYQGRAPPSLFL